MIHQLFFTYLACQTCQAKIHCDQCGISLSQSLLQTNEIVQADFNMTSKMVTLASSLNLDEIEIRLEDLGILID